ncbi:enoyl-CoA hydratase-related protein [Aquamicrobium lusatiense]|uniref:enoyl-CoA hydratase-related protein n=1 Tax=Aquamicrobium lusatiense TaxID=89772 RepID=UPI002458DB51|nr:enoyl-CoA hydratase-related protein [Aquamicrobium lusatiense]MDH4989683.1 enoyl-CoA hydratase-related protein [Aquamicrobium lusatiense]
MDSLIRTAREGRVFIVTLDRPRANAINIAMSEQLAEAFTTFRDDDDLSVAIVTGAGDKFFCGGWDMNEAASGVKDNEEHGTGGFAGLQVLLDCNKPLIAALNGLTVGGGWEISLACDLVLATPNTRFWFPEVQRGFIADAGGVQRLPRMLPRRIAMEILLTGRWFEVAEAERWGMINAIVESDELMPRAMELAKQIAKGAPLSVQATKEVVRATETMSDRDALTGLNGLALPLHQKMLASSDFLEGPKAFTEGRAPVWTGR